MCVSLPSIGMNEWRASNLAFQNNDFCFKGLLVSLLMCTLTALLTGNSLWRVVSFVLEGSSLNISLDIFFNALNWCASIMLASTLLFGSIRTSTSSIWTGINTFLVFTVLMCLIYVKKELVSSSVSSFSGVSLIRFCFKLLCWSVMHTFAKWLSRLLLNCAFLTWSWKISSLHAHEHLLIHNKYWTSGLLSCGGRSCRLCLLYQSLVFYREDQLLQISIFGILELTLCWSFSYSGCVSDMNTNSKCH